MYEFTTSHLSSLRLKKARLVRRAGVFALIATICLLSLVYVWQRVQVISIGYRIEALKKERDELVRVNKSLQIEAATLTSPVRIAAIAHGSIGMKPAADTQVVLVKRLRKGAGPPADGSQKAEKPAARPGRS